MANIKNLPDHIMIEIFENLSPKMIKTCSLVCKSWDGIIANTTNLMGKFRLNLEKSEKNIETAKEHRRKHLSAFIRDFSQNTLDVICMHNLKSLTASFYAKGIKASTLVKTLNKLPALMYLDTKFMYTEDDISNIVDFKKIRINLKELRCAAIIINILDCCTLTTLELSSKVSYNYSVKSLIDFLSQPNDLKELILSGEDVDNLFSSNDVLGLKFSLKSISVSKFEPFLHYERFIQFLQLQKRSLTRLQLNFCTEPPFGIEMIHNFVIEKLTNLKHLELDHDSNSDEDSDVEDYIFTFKDLTPEMLKINTKLKLLKLKASTAYNKFFPSERMMEILIKCEANSILNLVHGILLNYKLATKMMNDDIFVSTFYHQKLSKLQRTFTNMGNNDISFIEGSLFVLDKSIWARQYN